MAQQTRVSILKIQPMFHNGIVYVVAGSAGQLDGTSAGYPHNAMYYSDVSVGGAFFFEVEQTGLDAKWVCADGVIRDQFTMMKNVNKTTNLTIPPGTPTQLDASWLGNYSWNTSETTRVNYCFTNSKYNIYRNGWGYLFNGCFQHYCFGCWSQSIYRMQQLKQLQMDR